MIKKLLFILPVLLLSTAQIEAMKMKKIDHDELLQFVIDNDLNMLDDSYEDEEKKMKKMKENKLLTKYLINLMCWK